LSAIPLHPEIHVFSRSRNPLALVSAVRHALRRAGVDHRRITDFSSQAFAGESPDEQREVCEMWVSVDAPLALPPACNKTHH